MHTQHIHPCTLTHQSASILHTCICGQVCIHSMLCTAACVCHRRRKKCMHTCTNTYTRKACKYTSMCMQESHATCTIHTCAWRHSCTPAYTNTTTVLYTHVCRHTNTFTHSMHCACACSKHMHPLVLTHSGRGGCSVQGGL